MIKLFRKIRQNLLVENKTGKYLKYAFGEILLVVIGILIALQINNWNEGRKKAANEAYILNEILNNLNEDDEQIEHILERRMATQTAVEKILKILNTKPLDENGIEKHIAQFLTFERFYPMNNAFEMMKSNGLVVENKNLRTAISRYYDFEQKKATQSIKDVESVIVRILESENAIRSNLKSADSGTKKNTSVSLRNTSDPKFLELLQTELIIFKDNNSTSAVRISDFKNLNNNLTTMIQKELNKRRLSKYL
jgi:hypothetical protein